MAYYIFKPDKSKGEGAEERGRWGAEVKRAGELMLSLKFLRL
jgi:hypothetical protein